MNVSPVSPKILAQSKLIVSDWLHAGSVPQNKLVLCGLKLPIGNTFNLVAHTNHILIDD